jgi:hypothetical protein
MKFYDLFINLKKINLMIEYKNNIYFFFLVEFRQSPKSLLIINILISPILLWVMKELEELGNIYMLILQNLANCSLLTIYIYHLKITGRL